MIIWGRVTAVIKLQKLYRGFTLVELLIVIAISVILYSVALPSFHDITLSSKLTSATNDLIGDMRVARSEAIKRNNTLVLCPSANSTSCSTATDLRDGWIIYADSNANSTLDTGDTLIRAHGATANGLSVTSSASFPLLFRPSGVGATATTIKVCRTLPPGGQERIISVTATGKPSVSTTNTGICP
jgi:type IV fimbrial biogenesis protein FimT